MNKVERELKKYNDLKAKLDAQAEKVEQAKEMARQAVYDVLLDAIVLGDRFKIRHGMTAPYCHEYYVTGNDIKRGYLEPVTCKGSWMVEMPKALFGYLVNHGWTEDNFKELAKEAKKGWKKLVAMTTYNKDMLKPSDAYLHGCHIADGYETDGFYHIMAGHCGGDYSSCTTSIQNELSRELVALRGFCWDGLHAPQFNAFISAFYKRHGLDGNFDDWAKRNPTRCMANSEYYKGE